MRRELLLALLGHGGDVFVKLETAPGASGAEAHASDSFTRPRFELNAAAGCVDACEAGALRSLLPLASLYCALHEFVETRLTNRTSLYVAALCDAVSSELALYRAAVVAVEQDLIRDDKLPLVGIRERLMPFHHVFRALVAAIADVADSKLVGGQLLDRLFTGSLSGSPTIRSTFERLLARCHQVFYNQLISWVVYGRLPVGAPEFFVAAEASPAPPGAVALNVAMLPSKYIPLRVAESILFIGKSVQLLSGAAPPALPSRTATAPASVASDTASVSLSVSDRMSVGSSDAGSVAPPSDGACPAVLTDSDRDAMLQQLLALKTQATFHALTVRQ